MKFKTPLAEYLWAHDKKQAELTAVLGCNQPHVSDLTSGRRSFTLAKAAKIVEWSKGRLSFWDLLPPYKRPRGL